MLLPGRYAIRTARSCRSSTLLTTLRESLSPPPSFSLPPSPPLPLSLSPSLPQHVLGDVRWVLAYQRGRERKGEGERGRERKGERKGEEGRGGERKGERKGEEGRGRERERGHP
eukprot:1600467-Rhodomonas_salina.6